MYLPVDQLHFFLRKMGPKFRVPPIRALERHTLLLFVYTVQNLVSSVLKPH